MVTAAGTLGSIAVAAARVPALTALATAATARKRRRVGPRGGNLCWAIADVFVGGVLCTLSARVRDLYLSRGSGQSRGGSSYLPLRLLLCYAENYDESNICYAEKGTARHGEDPDHRLASTR